MSTEEQLIANRMDLETLRQWLDVDTLAYLSLEDMKAAATADFQPCMACFDNDYPAGRPENPMETSCCGS
jgi:amidophosphoribosyltransferase